MADRDYKVEFQCVPMRFVENEAMRDLVVLKRRDIERAFDRTTDRQVVQLETAAFAKRQAERQALRHLLLLAGVAEALEAAKQAFARW